MGTAFNRWLGMSHLRKEVKIYNKEIKAMKLNGKWYEILKWLAVIFLPALSVFVSQLFPIWGIPYGSQISDTIAVINTFIGAIICVSTINYNKSQKTDK